MSKPLEKQNAIVTGGSRGYGAGIAEALVAAGAQVWITGRNAEKLKAAAERIGAKAFVADVADGAAWDRLVETVRAEAGSLDILVNNAGEGVKITATAEQTDADIQQSIASNLTGSIMGCTRAARVMTEQRGGLIINVGSVCAKHAWPTWGIYSAAKAGILQFTRCLLTELRPHGVRVTSVIPSWGQTEFTEAAGLGSRDAEVLPQCIAPLELGELIVQIARQPAHLVTEEVTIWPMVQPMGQL
jgi:NAD(P)-dependent dehydrogenase (short-subunit alcohol dehydrogenase family)